MVLSVANGCYSLAVAFQGRPACHQVATSNRRGPEAVHLILAIHAALARHRRESDFGERPQGVTCLPSRNVAGTDNLGAVT